MNKNQGIELDESCFNTGNGGDDNIPLWQLDISCNQQDHREHILRQCIAFRQKQYAYNTKRGLHPNQPAGGNAVTERTYKHKKAGANASAFYIFEELILHSVNLLCKLGFQISSLVLMDN